MLAGESDGKGAEHRLFPVEPGGHDVPLGEPERAGEGWPQVRGTPGLDRPLDVAPPVVGLVAQDVDRLGVEGLTGLVVEPVDPLVELAERGVDPGLVGLPGRLLERGDRRRIAASSGSLAPAPSKSDACVFRAAVFAPAQSSTMARYV